jgi:hypothetical protein
MDKKPQTQRTKVVVQQTPKKHNSVHQGSEARDEVRVMKKCEQMPN